MKKLLKFIGTVLAFIILLLLFLWASVNKIWSIPILLGFLGLCMFLLSLVDPKSNWRNNPIVGITGVLFIFTSGYLLCKNCHATALLTDIFMYCAFISLFVEGIALGITVIKKLINKLKS